MHWLENIFHHPLRRGFGWPACVRWKAPPQFVRRKQKRFHCPLYLNWNSKAHGMVLSKCAKCFLSMPKKITWRGVRYSLQGRRSVDKQSIKQQSAVHDALKSLTNLSFDKLHVLNLSCDLNCYLENWDGLEICTGKHRPVICALKGSRICRMGVESRESKATGFSS